MNFCVLAQKQDPPSAVRTGCVICSMYAAGAFQFQGGLRDNHLDYFNKPTSNIETIHPLSVLIQVWIVTAAVTAAPAVLLAVPGEYWGVLNTTWVCAACLKRLTWLLRIWSSLFVKLQEWLSSHLWRDDVKQISRLRVLLSKDVVVVSFEGDPVHVDDEWAGRQVEGDAVLSQEALQLGGLFLQKL